MRLSPGGAYFVGPAGSSFAAQRDGNGVFSSADGKVVVDTDTYNKNGKANRPTYLAAFDDGNVALVDSLDNSVLWSQATGRIKRAADNPAFFLTDIEALAYIAAYPDLMGAFGANPQAGRDHMAANGINEGRTNRFDLAAYLLERPDLAPYFAAQGMIAPEIQKAALEHYIIYGRFEKAGVKPPVQWSDSEALAYVASYNDLMDAFGPDAQAGRNHFAAHGMNEGRGFTFTAAGYMEQRSDVRAYFEGKGMSGQALDAAATKHFITNGRYEAQGIAPPGPPAPPVPDLATLLGVENVGTSLTDGILRPNQALVSENGKYAAVYHRDGRFIVYALGEDNTVTELWEADLSGRADDGYLRMQRDGNLVVYDDDGDAEWDSGSYTNGVNRPFTVVMQNDGNLVIYDSQGGEATWSWMTGIIARPEANAA